MPEAKIEVAWPLPRAEAIAEEERQAGREARVSRYDDETYCVHVTDPYGTQSGLAARYVGMVQ